MNVQEYVQVCNGIAGGCAAKGRADGARIDDGIVEEKLQKLNKWELAKDELFLLSHVPMYIWFGKEKFKGKLSLLHNNLFPLF